MSLKFKSFKKTRVEELRKALVNDFGYRVEDAEAISGKTQLVQIYKEEEVKKLKSAALAQVGGVDDIYKKPEAPSPPLPSEPEWTDYVLDQLTEDEIEGGYPKANGLRRLIELLVGEIIGQKTEVVCAPNDVNGGYATVVHTVKIVNCDGDYCDVLEYCGAVDVSAKTLKEPFRYNLVATAETKAESRAFKRALKIKTNTAEEMIDKDVKPDTSGDKINDNQITCINLLKKRLNSDLPILATYGKTNVEDLTFDEAVSVIQILQAEQFTGIKVDGN